MSHSEPTECPSCGRQATLVSHHDHFGDECVSLCEKVIGRAFEVINKLHAVLDGKYVEVHHSPRVVIKEINFVFEASTYESYSFETFGRTDICPACNSICPRVKRQHPMLPRWVSFSPTEMTRLGPEDDVGFPSLKPIWAARRELYRERFRDMISIGISREAIENMWHNPKPRSSLSDSAVNRRKMFDLLDRSTTVLELAEIPDNEENLAAEMRRLGWDRGCVNNFCYWYARKHGRDPTCRKNRLGVGQTAYTRWVGLLVEGDLPAATSHLRYHQHWARRG